MADGRWLCGVALLVFSLILACECSQSDVGKPCTYFGGSRVSFPESSLVNCSWYASNACCKRTEVTSVFGGMKAYPLYGATKECRNQMNYLMCYFCSPEQHRWYSKKAYVCEEYCNLVFENCRTAKFNGKELGTEYSSGTEFCRGQKFEVVESNGNCFNFDPTVFAASSNISPSVITILSSVGCLLKFYDTLLIT